MQEKRIWMIKASQEMVQSVCKKIFQYNDIYNETLQTTTHSGHDGRGKAKAQTKLTFAVSQAKHILNMCEIHISLNFSFKFGEIILILFNIKPV